MDLLSSPQSALSVVTLRQLQYFVAVAEYEHFTRASERLLVAQPALSRQVKELEDALGVALLVRGTRGVRLTEAGRKLLVQARRILAMLESSIDAVRSVAADERGRLRLGFYGPCFYNHPVTRSAFAQFRTEAPDAEVISHELFSEQILPALRDDRIDVGIARAIAPTSDIESRIISIERLVVLLPGYDELATKSEVALEELNGRDLISFPADLAFGLSQRVVEVARDANITWNTVQEFTQLCTIAYHVSRGEGVSILPKSYAIFPTPGVAIREISAPHPMIELFAFTRRGEQSPGALRFLQLLGSLERDPSAASTR